MEVLMNRIFYPLKLTPEDDLLIQKWKWRLAAVYGAILLMLILIVAAAPYTKTDAAKSGGEAAFSSAAIPDQLSAP
jgi:hypothetical protein